MDETAKQILYVGIGLFVSGFLLLINYVLKKNAKHDDALLSSIELLKIKVAAIEKRHDLIQITLDFTQPSVIKSSKDINEAYVLIRQINKVMELLRERSHWVNNELTKMGRYLPEYRPSDFPIIKE